MQQPFTTTKRILESVIRKNSRNPAQEYFNGLQWDGIERLDNWLIDYCGAVYDDPDYVRAIGRKWLAAAVARIFEPGTKFDSMLILEGAQNAGKSFILRELATINGRAYFNDAIKISDLGTDRIIMKLQGVIIIELAELSSFAKMSDEEKKAVISSQVDTAVLKYENEARIFPRQFVLAGTTNSTSAGYLNDSSGNRRFWCVRVGDKLDIEKLKRNKEQLWAEAVAAYRSKETLYLQDAIYDKAVEMQKKRMSLEPWHELIEPLAHDKDVVFMSEIWKGVGVADGQRNRKMSHSIGKIMTSLGFESKPRRNGGLPQPAWVRVNRDRELELD